MNLESFVGERRADWEELAGLAAGARGRPERLGAHGVQRLGSLYRAAAADLALARRRFPHESVVPFLDDLVGRARHLVYDAHHRRESLRQFVTTGYWRRVAERPWMLVVAAILLLAPAVLGARWALDDPGQAAGIVPAPYRSVTEPRGGGDLGLSAEMQAAFASEIFTNNIRVTFMAFAGGILAGLGTAAALIYNGVFFGVIAGLAAGAGNGPVFAELVLAHGVLELSCIVVASAAGLRMGWALVDPGRRRRGEAVAAESKQAVLVVLGTAPWLVLAGVVEGFITPTGPGLGGALGVGLTLGLLYWGLVAWRGRPSISQASSGLEA
ncbi:MAG: stage II sporulation protein M [Acidimicrobiales bacterium]